MLRLMMASLLLCGLGLGGQETPEPTALERWQSKSAADKELMLERFEKLRSLSAEDRAQLGERLHDLKRDRARLAEELPPVDRQQLHALPPLERQELLREHQIQELRRHGEELRVGLRPARQVPRGAD